MCLSPHISAISANSRLSAPNQGPNPKTGLGGGSGLSASFNSGLNTFGLNNSYMSGLGSLSGPSSNASSHQGSPQIGPSALNQANSNVRKDLPAWLGKFFLLQMSKG